MTIVTQNQHNNVNNDIFDGVRGRAAGSWGKPRASARAYLTITNNSPSTLYKLPNFSTKRSDFDKQNVREMSQKLSNDFQNMDPSVFNRMIKRGFYRIKKINDTEFSVYSIPNKNGNRYASFNNKKNSDSANARFSSRNRLIELIKANPDFCYFFTGTFDPKKYDRTNFPKLQASLTKWLRRRGIKYILIPEPHKDGSIHFHGLFDASIEPFLEDFDLSKKLPRKITDGIKEGREIKNFPAYAEQFGWVSIERVRTLEACAVYVSKYVSKSFDDVRFSTRRFFCSIGLKRPEFVYREAVSPVGFSSVFSDYIPKVSYRSSVSPSVCQRPLSKCEALAYHLEAAEHFAVPHRSACRRTGDFMLAERIKS